MVLLFVMFLICMLLVKVLLIMLLHGRGAVGNVAADRIFPGRGAVGHGHVLCPVSNGHGLAVCDACCGSKYF